MLSSAAKSSAAVVKTMLGSSTGPKLGTAEGAVEAAATVNADTLAKED